MITNPSITIDQSVFQLVVQIRKLVSNGEKEKALEQLQAAFSDNPTIITLSARFSLLRQEELNGTVSSENRGITHSKITLSILEFVEALFQKAVKETSVFIGFQQPETNLNIISKAYDYVNNKGFNIFSRKDIPAGSDIAGTIEQRINESQYFIFFITETIHQNSVAVKALITAFYRQNSANPLIIIPIRIKGANGSQLPFHQKLVSIQHLNWQDESDTSTLLKDLFNILSQESKLVLKPSEGMDKINPNFPIAPLENPSSPVSLDSKYYIERATEKGFIKNIERPGAILRIRGPRQYGKTSLLNRVKAHANTLKYPIVHIDFQEFDEATLSNLENLLLEFCYYFAEKFKAEEALEKRWKSPRAKKVLCRSFIEKAILKKFNQPILLAIDAADRLFKYPKISEEFFLMLRSWHEKSSMEESKEWRHFRLALTYSTEARLAIAEINASPFNVGSEDKLELFTIAQIKDLSNRHSLNWNEGQIKEIAILTGGQPYLVRQAMYWVSDNLGTYEQLIQKATASDGPFYKHLRHLEIQLAIIEEVKDSFYEIINGGNCFNEMIAAKLVAAGLVKGSVPKLEMANQLYTLYFNGKL